MRSRGPRLCTKNATEWGRGLGAAVSKASATQSSWPRRPSGPVWSTPGPTHIPAKSVKPVSHDQHPQGTLILRPPPNSPPRHPRTWTPLFLTPPSPGFPWASGSPVHPIDMSIEDGQTHFHSLFLSEELIPECSNLFPRIFPLVFQPPGPPLSSVPYS